MEREPVLSVSDDHPALPGHFPGRPIVPGVVILDLLVADWRRRRPDAPLTGVRKMKFVRMLAPGEAFTVEWADPRDRKVAFVARVGDKPLASGQIELA